MTRPRRIPIALKVVYTAFVAVLVPVYWRNYGPQNFLYFCDVALLVTLVGIWLESSLLVSTQAVGILLPQMLWLIDFGAGLFGYHPIGMTAYMFGSKYSLPLRGLSLFHGWLPILLVYLVARLGYDRRALLVQSAIGIALLLICYLIPPIKSDTGRPYNLNYVFGLGDEPQTRMPKFAWFSILLVGLPLAIYLPTHLLLRSIFAPPKLPMPGAPAVA